MTTIEQSAEHPDNLPEYRRALRRRMFTDALAKPLSPKPKEPVFHYTSSDSFKGILEQGPLWVTNAAYLNDPNELSYPVEFCLDVLQEVGKSQSDKSFQQFLESVTDKIRSHVGSRSWYFASFSRAHDLLSQWRAYCPSGGYSIAFNAAELITILNSRENGLFEGLVTYDETDQKRRIQETIKNWLNIRKEVRDQYPSVGAPEFEQAVAHYLGVTLGLQFVFFKMPAFKEENEWRLALYQFPDENVEFRVIRGILTPYIKVDLRNESGKLPLECVYVGPMGDQGLARHSAELLLISRQYDNAGNIIQKSGYRLQ